MLLGILELPGPLITVLAAAVVVGVTLVVARRGYEPASALSVALTALLLVTTPVQPWYAVAVAGVGALAGPRV